MSTPTREQAVGPLAYAPRWARDQPPRDHDGQRMTSARFETVPDRQACGINGPCNQTKAASAEGLAIAAERPRRALTPEVVSEPPPQHPERGWPAVRQLACVTLLAASSALALLWLSASHEESHADDAVARAQSPLPHGPTMVAATIEAAAAPPRPFWSVDVMLWPVTAIGRDQAHDLTVDPAAVAAATALGHPGAAVAWVPGGGRR
jgi:hypothetical protein